MMRKLTVWACAMVVLLLLCSHASAQFCGPMYGGYGYAASYGYYAPSYGYAAGYYVYLWAEVLDADGFDAFVEAGDPFDAEVARRLARFIYSSGNSIEPGEAYRAFRGRPAAPEPMLRQRGLLEPVEG